MIGKVMILLNFNLDMCYTVQQVIFKWLLLKGILTNPSCLKINSQYPVCCHHVINCCFSTTLLQGVLRQQCFLSTDL